MKKKYIIIIAVLPIVTAVLFFLCKPHFSKNYPDFYIFKANDTKRNDSIIDSTKKRLFLLNEKTPYIVIDRYINKLYLRTNEKILLEALCSTGKGNELTDTLGNRRWIFDTPQGVFTVDAKLENPWWRKPDWAFIEEGEAIPKDDRERLDPEMLGEYAIGFGDGYYIHGTLYERLLGVNVTHGCVRLGAQDLRFLYNKVKAGTRVYVY
ncbi:MAG: L,D-transpeptidase [Candidatus Zixiibacteriota bacterium]